LDARWLEASREGALADQPQPGTAGGPEFPAAMAAVRFHSPREAQVNFSRIARRVPLSLLSPLSLLLAESPNPDAALNLFERLVYPESLDVIRSMERHPQLLHYALALFANSQYLGETLIQNPDLLQGLLREDSLGRAQSPEDFAGAFARFRSRSSENDTSLLLARFRRREYVRIVLRDILGIAELAEITAEISALTDVLIEEALRICESGLRKRYGTPQHYDAENRLAQTRFSVLSLGKLGGNELNYSSDIDLLYLFEDGRDAETTSISGREFFIRLAQELTDVWGGSPAKGRRFASICGCARAATKASWRFSSDALSSITAKWRTIGSCRRSSRSGIRRETSNWRAASSARCNRLSTGEKLIFAPSKPPSSRSIRSKSASGAAWPAAVWTPPSTSNSTAEACATSSSWCSVCSASTAAPSPGCTPAAPCSRCKNCTTRNTSATTISTS
jgi:hypothetical protein